MTRTRLLALVAGSLLPACAGSPAPTQLEGLTAVDPADQEWSRESLTGTVAVAGADKDWTLTVGDAAASRAIEVHSPGKVDLSALDGQALTVELGDAWPSDHRDIVVSDASGPVYVGRIGAHGLADDTLGEGFATYGDEVATGSQQSEYGTYELSYRTAVFHGDDGDVELSPGEPEEVTLKGVTWRIVVAGAYQVIDWPNALPACGGGIDDTLMFEALRVDGTPDLDPVDPVDGARIAGDVDCG